MIEQYDDKRIRCPRVGGEVNFMFCRSENNLFPCRFISGCWQGRVDIKEFLEEHFPDEEVDLIFAPPKPKLVSLLESMEEAKRRLKQGA